MEKIEITTRFRSDGTLQPLAFNSGGQTIQVFDMGRQWESPEGRHMLVRDDQRRTYHLLFQLADLSWYLVKDIKPANRPT